MPCKLVSCCHSLFSVSRCRQIGSCQTVSILSMDGEGIDAELATCEQGNQRANTAKRKRIADFQGWAEFPASKDLAPQSRTKLTRALNNTRRPNRKTGAATLGAMSKIHAFMGSARIGSGLLLSLYPIPSGVNPLILDKYLEVPAWPGVWAVGDCAVVPDPRTGKPHPPTAQHALREGKVAALNILATIRQDRKRPFVFSTLGQLAAIGRRTGVANILGVNFSGFFAWWLWRTVLFDEAPALRKKGSSGVGLDPRSALLQRPRAVHDRSQVNRLDAGQGVGENGSSQASHDRQRKSEITERMRDRSSSAIGSLWPVHRQTDMVTVDEEESNETPFQ